MDESQIAVTVRGEVGPKDVQYARHKVARVARWTDKPVVFARVKLTAAPDPARERPALAQAALELDGAVVRAHVAARRMSEAVDLLEERLRAQVESHKDRRLASRKRGTEAREPGEWRHGDLPAHRPDYFPRTVEDRQVVRHKSYALRALSPADAYEEMLRLDYDFHLFTDVLTGEDSLVHRLADGGGDLQSLSHPSPAPVLQETQAAARLDSTGEPFVFYRDADSGRGAVVYRRYDGHYGLITATVLVAVNHGPGSSSLPRPG
jgi:ribosome-associated translation inhibitor RaiA